MFTHKFSHDTAVSILDSVIFAAIPKKLKFMIFFFQFVLSLKPTSISPKYRSGGEKLVRPLSSGKQSFDSDEKMWPVNKAMPKLEAYSQCSGTNSKEAFFFPYKYIRFQK